MDPKMETSTFVTGISDFHKTYFHYSSVHSVSYYLRLWHKKDTKVMKILLSKRLGPTSHSRQTETNFLQGLDKHEIS